MNQTEANPAEVELDGGAMVQEANTTMRVLKLVYMLHIAAVIYTEMS